MLMMIIRHRMGHNVTPIKPFILIPVEAGSCLGFYETAQERGEPGKAFKIDHCVNARSVYFQNRLQCAEKKTNC